MMTIPEEALQLIARKVIDFEGSPDWERGLVKMRTLDFRQWEQEQIADIIRKGIAEL